MTASVDTPLPGDLPGAGAVPAAGALAAPDLPAVDDRIAQAFGALGLARRRFAETPSGDSVTACLSAEAVVNELLELRLMLSRGVATLGT